MKHIFKPIIVILALAAFACSKAPKTAGTIPNTDSLTMQWVNAWNSADSAKLDSLIAEDITVVADTMFDGLPAVKKGFIQPVLGKIRNLECLKTAALAKDGMAFETGSYRHYWALNDSITGIQKGYYTLIWQAGTNGEWKVKHFFVN